MDYLFQNQDSILGKPIVELRDSYAILNNDGSRQKIRIKDVFQRNVLTADPRLLPIMEEFNKCGWTPSLYTEDYELSKEQLLEMSQSISGEMETILNTNKTEYSMTGAACIEMSEYVSSRILEWGSQQTIPDFEKLEKVYKMSSCRQIIEPLSKIEIPHITRVLESYEAGDFGCAKLVESPKFGIVILRKSGLTCNLNEIKENIWGIKSEPITLPISQFDQQQIYMPKPLHLSLTIGDEKPEIKASFYSIWQWEGLHWNKLELFWFEGLLCFWQYLDGVQTFHLKSSAHNADSFENVLVNANGEIAFIDPCNTEILGGDRLFLQFSGKDKEGSLSVTITEKHAKLFSNHPIFEGISMLALSLEKHEDVSWSREGGIEYSGTNPFILLVQKINMNVQCLNWGILRVKEELKEFVQSNDIFDVEQVFGNTRSLSKYAKKNECKLFGRLKQDMCQNTKVSEAFLLNSIRSLCKKIETKTIMNLKESQEKKEIQTNFNLQLITDSPNETEDTRQLKYLKQALIDKSEELIIKEFSGGVLVKKISSDVLKVFYVNEALDDIDGATILREVLPYVNEVILNFTHFQDLKELFERLSDLNEINVAKNILNTVRKIERKWRKDGDYEGIVSWQDEIEGEGRVALFPFLKANSLKNSKRLIMKDVLIRFLTNAIEECEREESEVESSSEEISE